MESYFNWAAGSQRNRLVPMRPTDPLVGQIRAALDARRLGYSSERTLELMRERGFGIEVVELAVPR